MKGYTYKKIMSPEFDMPTDRAGLESVYRTLAKVADQRLVRLEQASKGIQVVGGKEVKRGEEWQRVYKNVTDWSYRRAMRDIGQWSGGEATRFNTAAPASDAMLEAKIEDIKTFLKSQTSTIQGIKQTFKDRADTLNEKFDTNFKWNDMAEYFDSELDEKLSEQYGSETKFYVLAEIQKNKKKILKGIDKAKEVNIKAPDEMVGMFVQEAIENLGPQVKEYLDKTR